MIREGDKILLGVSGGKDSVALLYILAKFQNNLKFKLLPIFIDLGINRDNYSQYSREIVENHCQNLELDLLIADVKREYGFSIDEVFSKKLRKPVCSICGTVKRYILNRKAIELGVEKVATGHNLTDEATILLQNIINVNIDFFSKFTPVQPAVDRLFAGRIKPFFEIYEEEISLYVTFKNIGYVEVKCLYAKGASTLQLKKIILNIENMRPGAALTMVKGFYKKIRPIIQKKEEKLNKCRICGMPTITEICAFCKLRNKILTDNIINRQ
ncbi:MAG: TIGR00269 family protein [Candidatus Baldrarchaeia archaeon]